MITDRELAWRRVQCTKGSVDQIFAMKQLIKKACEWNRKIYLAFLNLTKMYDLVDKESLGMKLKVEWPKW